jgi:NAD(P)-dependent dehydrogenase (short-subunit alcohol dehydrogenase family)
MTNKVALITGGARGIGAAIALEFARNGIDIAISYLNNDKAASLITAKAKEYGVRAIAIKSNAGNENDIKTLFNEIQNSLGNISYLVNNAAISNDVTPIAELNFDKLKEIFQVNMFGSVICCKYALKQMQEIQGNKAIVNITSQAAEYGGNSLMSHYASSKAALNTFTKSIAKDFIKYGIRVNAVSPAVIDTDTHKNINDERREHFNKTIPMKRMGRSEEVADLVYFLISEKSSYINGEIISINGGK